VLTMTTKKHSKRPRKSKARQPKFIEVHGRKLTAAQYREYESELETRIRICPGDSLKRSEAAALREVLYRARPSVQAKKRLETMDLWRRANEAFMTLGGFRDDRLLGSLDPKLVTLANAILGHIAGEFQAVGVELAGMHSAIETETREQLRVRP
jgi:hypothetical protein